MSSQFNCNLLPKLFVGVEAKVYISINQSISMLRVLKGHTYVARSLNNLNYFPIIVNYLCHLSYYHD